MMGSKAGTKIAEGTLAKVWGILYETKTVTVLFHVTFGFALDLGRRRQ